MPKKRKRNDFCSVQTKIDSNIYIFQKKKENDCQKLTAVFVSKNVREIVIYIGKVLF